MFLTLSRKSNRIVASSVVPSSLIPFSSSFSLKITSESGSMLLAILVYFQCRFNTAATSVTNALRSLLGLLASSLKWLVRPLGKGSKAREHGNVVRLMVGSMAAERACNARGSSYLRTRGRGCHSSGFVLSCLCPGCRASFTRFRSPYHRPLSSGPQANVHPQEKKSARCCRFESCNDSEFISLNSAFL